MYEGILSVKRLSKNASGIDYIETLFEILIGARIQQGLVKEIHLLKGEFDSALAHLHHSESINDRLHDIMIRQSMLAKTLSVLDMVMMLDTGFCVTTRGYIGRVSRSVKKGDVIAVILGGPAPFQLAEAEQDGTTQATYRFIGDGYFHGLTHGEALSLDSYHEEDILLV